MVDWKFYIDSPLLKSLDESGGGSLNEGNGCGSSCGYSPDGWGEGYGHLGNGEGCGWSASYTEDDAPFPNGDGVGPLYGSLNGDGWSSDEW